jgi:putative transferase (TIGR04331 family)
MHISQKKKHNNFFKELINSGIIHKNPISAAKLANSIVNDPASWWNTAKVQKARKNFLKKNLNIHNNLISDLKYHLKI